MTPRNYHDGAEQDPITRAIESAERHAMAPELIKKVAQTEDQAAVAGLAAELTVELREECIERGLGKHAGQAICYMIVDQLAEDSMEGTE